MNEVYSARDEANRIIRHVRYHLAAGVTDFPIHRNNETSDEAWELASSELAAEQPPIHISRYEDSLGGREYEERIIVSLGQLAIG